MSEETITQDHDGAALNHVLVRAAEARREAGVILFPTVMGVSPLEVGFAHDLAALGYDAMVADFYGRRFTPDTRAEAVQAMNALKEDRAALRDRLLAILGAASDATGLGPARLAATGYCFGGLCCLDLARSGVGITGVAAFHGLFDPPGLEPKPIRARVIAYHGWDDPLAPPDKVVAFAREMTDAGCDWQLHAFGHTAHGFTNPGATGAIAGVKYEPSAAARSWRGLTDYLAELLA
jgi:dienelactone hydrolase